MRSKLDIINEVWCLPVVKRQLQFMRFKDLFFDFSLLCLNRYEAEFKNKEFFIFRKGLIFGTVVTTLFFVAIMIYFAMYY